MGFYDHSVGLHLTSADGVRWSDPQIAYYDAERYFDKSQLNTDRLNRFERPQSSYEKRQGRLSLPVLAGRSTQYRVGGGF